MSSSARLRWSAIMIVVSAIYAIILTNSPDVASAISLGYIAALLTVFVAVNVWKKP